MFVWKFLLFLVFWRFSRPFIIRNVEKSINEVSPVSFDLADRSNSIQTEFPYQPNYEVQTDFLNNETIQLTFVLFLSEKNDKKSRNSSKRFVSIPSKPIETFRYSVFTIEQKETDLKEMLQLRPLQIHKNHQNNSKYFSQSLILNGLNPNESYSICIFYYQTNLTIRRPDLFICEVLLKNLKRIDDPHSDQRSSYTFLVILVQYSIIFGILFILQTTFSIRKRRIAELVHQRLMSKAQRFRNSISSMSFARPSISSSSPDDDRYTKEVEISSDPSTSIEENEAFLIKTNSNKNHVQFLLCELDETEEPDENVEQTKKSILSHRDPYGDQPDALLSMAHILESDKPWAKYKRPSISIF